MPPPPPACPVRRPLSGIPRPASPVRHSLQCPLLPGLTPAARRGSLCQDVSSAPRARSRARLPACSPHPPAPTLGTRGHSLNSCTGRGSSRGSLEKQPKRAHAQSVRSTPQAGSRPGQHGFRSPAHGGRVPASQTVGAGAAHTPQELGLSSRCSVAWRVNPRRLPRKRRIRCREQGPGIPRKAEEMGTGLLWGPGGGRARYQGSFLSARPL